LHVQGTVCEWALDKDTYKVVYIDGEQEILTYHTMKSLVLSTDAKNTQRPTTSQNPAVLVTESYERPKRDEPKAQLRLAKHSLVSRPKKGGVTVTPVKTHQNDTALEETRREALQTFVCCVSSGGCGAVFLHRLEMSIHKGRWYFDLCCVLAFKFVIAAYLHRHGGKLSLSVFLSIKTQPLAQEFAATSGPLSLLSSTLAPSYAYTPASKDCITLDKVNICNTTQVSETIP